MHTKQHTIQRDITVSGTGLHTGIPASLTFKPAPEDHGILFCRADLDGKPTVRADVDLVSDTQRGTTLTERGVSVHTVEHVMAAAAGLQIDNLLIELTGPEPPAMDGSAIAFVRALLEAGLQQQEAARPIFILEEAIQYQEPARKVDLAVLPASHFQASVMIDFESSVLKPQYAYMGSMDAFAGEMADSRTFCFLHEVLALHRHGLVQGGSLENAMVMADRPVPAEDLGELTNLFGLQAPPADAGLLNPEGFRHENEPARHKLLDLIGDLALIGTPIQGHVVATRPGHKANIELARKIKSAIRQKRITSRFQKTAQGKAIFDINAIHEILPHRYPFLLVDKVVEFSENRIVGIKNVTINEPFFQGHFPGNPIMPAVLQLEAMAQIGGILLLNTIENPKTVWVYFVAIDNARFKKPVIPGDTLQLELEMTNLRRSICMMTGKAFVDGQLVSSADMVASIVPKQII
ncbi:MAG: bifunctional UDP-3-O-[3-hydroxymyristoyl] N-acetylglucosamine deacetylase/3-hydroxyacyl-ACP dehydratase [Bacteroidia bacterium]|nr:bifunctional UDP-3-O-[3-hydroxymyristoyl] N-acetylglucosamine deacetylase/3-hydroxyacyl-ACP dehydratase [Bacteroidia bacterium]